MDKLFYLDVETTGLDAKKNGIWQLAGIVEIGGKEEDRINLKMRPWDMSGVKNEDYALKMNNLTGDQLNELPASAGQFAEFLSFMRKYVSPFDKADKFIMVGYNVRFDNDFVRQWFIKHGNDDFGSWFHRHYYDIMSVAMTYFRGNNIKPLNYKLETVGRFLGLVGDDANLHDAMYDIELTRAVDKTFIELNSAPF